MAINDDIVSLKKFNFFSKLTTEQLQLLVFGAERKSFATGDVIFKEGDLAESAYVIFSGTVNLYRQNNLIRPVEIINNYALLDELALITEINRHFTAIAHTDCKLLKINRTVFLRLINEFPEITRHIYDYVSERIRELASNVSHLPNFK